MGKHKQTNTNVEPDNQQNSVEATIEDSSGPKYVVLRAGVRVSDKEYTTPSDVSCKEEIEFWTRVAKNTSYGEKVEAVLYDAKKHRVW